MNFVYRNDRKIRNYFKNRKFICRKIRDYRWLMSLVLIGLLLGGISYFVPGGITGNVATGFDYVNSKSNENSKMEISKKLENITFETFPSYFENDEIVKNLPEDALINLGVGNVNYIIKKGNINFGKSENADIKIWMPEIYLKILGNKGLCEAVQDAKEKGDFWVDTYLSKFELSWKYKSMIKYKNCLF